MSLYDISSCNTYMLFLVIADIIIIYTGRYNIIHSHPGLK